MDDPQQPRRRRRTRLILGLSLALNLIVFGVIAGALTLAWSVGPERPGAELRAAGRLPVAAMLPKEARAALRDGLQAQYGGERAFRDVEREQRRRLDQALREDPFDPARVAAIFAENRDFRDVRAAEVDTVLVEVLSGMSAQQREAFADRVQRRDPRGSRHAPGGPPR